MKAGIIVLILLALIGGYIFFTTSAWLDVKYITLQGNGYKSLEELKTICPFYIGNNIFRVSLKEMENKIRKDKRIERVNVKRRLPDRLIIFAQKKEPIFLINLDYLYGFTFGKEIIPLDSFPGNYNFPIITGIDLDSFRFYERLNLPEAGQLIDFYQALYKIDRNFFNQISEVNLKEKTLSFSLLPYGIWVVLGQGEWEKKLQRLKAVLAQWELAEYIRKIDMSYANQAIVEKRVKEKII